MVRSAQHADPEREQESVRQAKRGENHQGAQQHGDQSGDFTVRCPEPVTRRPDQQKGERNESGNQELAGSEPPACIVARGRERGKHASGSGPHEPNRQHDAHGQLVAVEDVHEFPKKLHLGRDGRGAEDENRDRSDVFSMDGLHCQSQIS